MPPYRCYFRADSGHIVWLETIRCASDDEAKDAAAALLRERLDYAVEVWDIGRQLTRLTRDAPRRSA